jgi:hypothetical protein
MIHRTLLESLITRVAVSLELEKLNGESKKVLKHALTLQRELASLKRGLRDMDDTIEERKRAYGIQRIIPFRVGLHDVIRICSTRGSMLVEVVNFLFGLFTVLTTLWIARVSVPMRAIDRLDCIDECHELSYTRIT